jgi:RNA polymerase sigma-70 factor (ECF subfamily)
VHSLYQNHHPWLESLLRRRLGNRDDAADLAQDTFVRVLRSPVPQQDIREPRRYLATIARGLVTDLFRRRTLEQAYLEYLSHLPQALAPSPEDQAIIQQTLLDVDRMLQGLAP